MSICYNTACELQKRGRHLIWSRSTVNLYAKFGGSTLICCWVVVGINTYTHTGQWPLYPLRD